MYFVGFKETKWILETTDVTGYAVKEQIIVERRSTKVK